jgi:hypothetical protein
VSVDVRARYQRGCVVGGFFTDAWSLEPVNQAVTVVARNHDRMEDLHVVALDRLANRVPIVFDVLRRRNT